MEALKLIDKYHKKDYYFFRKETFIGGQNEKVIKSCFSCCNDSWISCM